MLAPLLEVAMLKSARRCGAKHISKSKCTKHTMPAPLLEVEMLKKCTPLWREARCQVKGVKNCWSRITFGRLDVVWCGRCKGFCTVSKVSKTWGAFQKRKQAWDMWRRFWKDAFRVASALQETCSSEIIRRSGHWFPEKGSILEHQIFGFAGVILPDRCSTSYDLASLFPGQRSTLDRWSGNHKRRPSALHSAFYVGRKSRRIASFLILSTWNLRKSRRISFIFKIAGR